jgi:hypothetical protein
VLGCFRKAVKSANPIPFAPINPHTNFSLAPLYAAIVMAEATATPATAKDEVLINFLLLVMFLKLVGSQKSEVGRKNPKTSVGNPKFIFYLIFLVNAIIMFIKLKANSFAFCQIISFSNLNSIIRFIL